MPKLEGLLEWYEPRRGAYPWRATGTSPYGVLVSEVMLQQTQAPRVAPAFERFMERFAMIGDLAAAPLGEVIRQWSGLGYNRRAVSLSRSARTVVAEHAGRIPSDPGTLRRLPGVGPYTAAAVASMAFGLPVPAIDTNARRVLSRALLGADPAEVSEAAIRDAAQDAIDRTDPGAWNQAVMDLGREVCRPAPRCAECPLVRACRFADPPPPAPRRAPTPRQGFQGSSRQARGAVIRMLSAGPRTLDGLISATAISHDRVLAAVRA